MRSSSKAILIPAFGALASACAPQKPNVVYVFPDQFRNCALSFWNEEEYAGAHGWQADPTFTPRINAFADESVVLSNAMSTCPISSPYRGMFLTGMFPERNGIISNCMTERPENTLNPDAICIGDAFKAAGYNCGYIGKLHADVPTPNDPEHPGQYVESRWPAWDAYTPPERRHGFDYWYSYGTFDEHKNPHYWDTEGKRHDPHEFSVKHDTDKAIEYLRNRDKKKPFLLCVAYNPPHGPYASLDDCMEEDYNLYKDMDYSQLYVRENADTSMSKAPSARYYFANVTAVDREFGRILDELKAQGLDKNTIVVFTADHGETMCSQGVEDPKNSIWSESFNVPFIIRYPKKLKHRIDPILLASTDIMPTLLGLAGVDIPASVQGRDYSATLLGTSQDRPASALYLRTLNGEPDADGYYRHFYPQARGLKTDRYTFEISINRDTTFAKMLLFDDIADPYQLHPLDIEQNADVVKDLCTELASELERSDDVWHREKILQKILKK